MDTRADQIRTFVGRVADNVEDLIITNRHKLWEMLGEIEAIRYSGPYYRVRRFG